MATRQPALQADLIFGPDDQGRFVSAEEFARARYVEPYLYERVEGRLAVMTPDGEGHVRQSEPWRDRLVIYKVAHLDRVELVVSGSWVRTADGTDRIADIAVYLIGGPEAAELHDRRPDLIFEIVSKSTEDRRRDFEEKRAEYHQIGVPEYVIVDRFQKRVTVLTHAPGGYTERMLGLADTYETPLLPGLAIPVGEVMGP